MDPLGSAYTLMVRRPLKRNWASEPYLASTSGMRYKSPSSRLAQYGQPSSEWSWISAREDQRSFCWAQQRSQLGSPDAMISTSFGGLGLSLSPCHREALP